VKQYDAGVPHTLDYPRHSLQQFSPHPARPIRTRRDGLRRSSGIDLSRDRSRTRSRSARDRFAGLQSLGVRKADRVALLLPCPQFVIAFYGGSSGRSCPVQPLYTAPSCPAARGTPGRELVALWPPPSRGGARWNAVRNYPHDIKSTSRDLGAVHTRARAPRGHRTTVDRPWGASFPNLLRDGAFAGGRPADDPHPPVHRWTTGCQRAVLSHRALVGSAAVRCGTRARRGRRADWTSCVFHVYGSTVIWVSGRRDVLIPRFISSTCACSPARSFAGGRALRRAASARPARYDLRSVEVPIGVPRRSRWRCRCASSSCQRWAGARRLGLTEAARSPIRRRDEDCASSLDGRSIPDVDAKIVTSTRKARSARRRDRRLVCVVRT